MWSISTSLTTLSNYSLQYIINICFRVLAQRQVEDYENLAEMLIKSSNPSKPMEWSYAKGWTRYNHDGTASSVDFPEDRVIVFDIECLVKEGGYPTMATALSPNYW